MGWANWGRSGPRQKAAKGNGKGAKPKGPPPRQKQQQQSKPKAKKQRQRKQIQGPRGTNRRMGNMLAYHSAVNVPVSVRSGTAFPIRGMTPSNIILGSLSGNVRYLIAVTNVGVSGSVMAMFRMTGLAVSTSVHTLPLLTASDAAGGPTSCRAMKAGLNIVNTTQLLERGGRVYYLQGTARVLLPAAPSLMTLAQANTLADTLVAHPDRHQYGGDAFGGKGLDFHCHVVDMVRYEDFDAFDGTQNIDTFYGHIAQWPGATVARDRPMSTIWIVLETPAVEQTYSLSAYGAFYTRWGVNTVQGQSMTQIPVAPLATINSGLSAGENAGKTSGLRGGNRR